MLAGLKWGEFLLYCAGPVHSWSIITSEEHKALQLTFIIQEQQMPLCFKVLMFWKAPQGTEQALAWWMRPLHVIWDLLNHRGQRHTLFKNMPEPNSIYLMNRSMDESCCMRFLYLTWLVMHATRWAKRQVDRVSLKFSSSIDIVATMAVWQLPPAVLGIINPSIKGFTMLCNIHAPVDCIGFIHKFKPKLQMSNIFYSLRDMDTSCYHDLS